MKLSTKLSVQKAWIVSMPMKDGEDIVRFLNEKKDAFIIFGRWEGWLSFVNNRVMKKIHGLFPTLDKKKKKILVNILLSLNFDRISLLEMANNLIKIQYLLLFCDDSYFYVLSSKDSQSIPTTLYFVSFSLNNRNRYRLRYLLRPFLSTLPINIHYVIFTPF